MRQFHQAGAEVFGAHGPDVDAELLAMGERIWRQLGLDDIRLAPDAELSYPPNMLLRGLESLQLEFRA